MSRASRWGRVALAVAGLGLWAGAVSADTYDVTVYNLTKGQIISPPVVAAHRGNIAIFRAGEEASDELAALAEDAAADALIDLLRDAGANVEIGGGVILPGEHATVRITTSRRNRRISAVGMLVTTNDAFFGLNGLRPRGRSTTVRVPAYDAGSEENNEDCAFIPGPPCGNAGERDVTVPAGEGELPHNVTVHIHNGIHGIGDLDPDQHDWRNPVAQITITRVSGEDGDGGEEGDRDDD